MNARYRQLVCLTLFSIAMAHVEAALVVYLRVIYYPGNLLDVFPLAILSERDFGIELFRETATLVMIMTVALIAEKGLARVSAAFLYVFGMWDIWYYAWLKLMIGWPQSWMEWDVLFLIPWPWFGPWITPVLFALMFVAWGGWTLYSDKQLRIGRNAILLFALAAAVGLAAFLLPAVPLLEGGTEAFRNFTPAEFPWFVYCTGYLLMLAGLWRASTNQEKKHAHSQ